jgi:hypothetical protein
MPSLTCSRLESSGKIRLRLLLLDRDASISSFVKPNGQLVSKDALCQNIKAKVKLLQGENAKARGEIAKLDSQLVELQKQMSSGSFMARKAFETTFNTISSIKTTRDFFEEGEYRPAYEVHFSPEEDMSANLQQRKEQQEKVLKENDEDVLAAKLETMAMFVASSKEDSIEKATYMPGNVHDRNMTKACHAAKAKGKGGMDDFRRQVLAAPKRFFKGKHLRMEHLFRPDGTARKTPEEVCTAIRKIGRRRMWGLLGS